jgi:beta-galactosidase
MERQLEIMKDMGVNALRTSHNACAPEVLDLCDRMGIIVFNELFDKYGPTASVQCSTGEYVDNYAEAEVANFVRRDRNHPSVFLWSIGNEIPDLLHDSDGRAAEHVANMVRYFKEHDTTRPTTMGCHIPSVSEGSKNILDPLETSGWNYGRRYASTRKAYPDMPLIYNLALGGHINYPYPNTRMTGPMTGR